ncbi:leucine-rich repeat extensin-like protein 5 [Meredithblackwellia eburnea MCA 4105]
MEPVSSNTTLATLLHQSDLLSREFNTKHASSLVAVQSVVSSFNQLSNLLAMPATPVTRSRPEGGIRERGMAKVQESIEQALSNVRDDLAKMEQAVSNLNSLLFHADVYLAEPGTALQHGLNPTEALNHVSNLFSSYQAELIRLREVLADFTTETIGPEEFLEEWKVMKEVDKGSQDELSELADMMGSWGGASSSRDVEMG